MICRKVIPAGSDSEGSVSVRGHPTGLSLSLLGKIWALLLGVAGIACGSDYDYRNRKLKQFQPRIPLIGGWALDQSQTFAHHAWMVVALSAIGGFVLLRFILTKTL